MDTLGRTRRRPFPTLPATLLVLALLAATPYAAARPGAGMSHEPMERTVEIVLPPMRLHLGTDTVEALRQDGDIVPVGTGQDLPVALDLWTTEIRLTLHTGPPTLADWDGLTVIVPVPLIGRVPVQLCAYGCSMLRMHPYDISGTLYLGGTVADLPVYSEVPLWPAQPRWP